MARLRRPRTPLAERLVETLDVVGRDAALADTLGVSAPTLQNYERGLNVPNAEFFSRLKVLSGVSVDWLLTGEGLMFDVQSPRLPTEAVIKTDMQSKYIKPIVLRLARIQKDKNLHLESDFVWWVVSSIHNALLEEHFGADVDTKEFDKLLTELIDKQMEIEGW